jgi:drug/metabolite transporter (DMT)-like permease
LTTSANAIFLQSTAPIYLLALGPLVLRERVRAVDVAVISVVATGAILIFVSTPRAVATAPDPVHGNLMGLASGLSWALTVSGLRWLEKREAVAGAAIITVTAGNVVAFAANLPMALPVTTFRPADVAVLLYLGVFQIGLAYAFLSRSIRHVPALESATLLMAEPALNPFWTWVVNGENPGAEAMAGGAAILAATLFGTWWSARNRTNPMDA